MDVPEHFSSLDDSRRPAQSLSPPSSPHAHVKYTPKKKIISELTDLFVTQGVYLLATLIQLRTSFPPTTATTTTPLFDFEKVDENQSLFSTLPTFELFGNLFDITFLLSSAGCVGWKWFDKAVNG